MILFNISINSVLIFIQESPALSAGLQYKDIVTKIDNKIIDGESSVQDFIKVVRDNPDRTLQLEVIRDSQVDRSVLLYSKNDL